jgi:hypothetical protein
LTLSVRTNSVVRAASAFLSTLVRRPREAAAEKVVFSVALPFSAAQQAGVENRCPVCQARFRGVRICSRCGADLQPLMVLAVKAWQLRQAARQALGAGDARRAVELASEAQGIHDTERGAALRLAAAWIAERELANAP